MQFSTIFGGVMPPFLKRHGFTGLNIVFQCRCPSLYRLKLISIELIIYIFGKRHSKKFGASVSLTQFQQHYLGPITTGRLSSSPSSSSSKEV